MAKSVKLKPAEKADTSALQFGYQGKKYNVTKGAKLPLGNEPVTLTAADICADEAAQKYVVENKCSCIEEVVE